MNYRIISLLIISVALVAGCTSTSNPPNATTCGGIEGIQCPSGYICDYEGDYPDSPGTCVQGPVKEFNMSASMFEFEPSTISVNKGASVVLHITSTDVEHGFSLATYNIIETLPVGETKTIRFTATEVGEFNFFCSVFCGSGHADMRGKLIVNP